MNNYEIKDFMNRITVYIPAALSPNGSKLAYISNISGAPQVWLGGLEKSSSGMIYPKPITTDKEKSPYVFQESLFFIDENKIAMAKDNHGNEHTFIEIHDLKNGTIESIPRGSGRDHINFVSLDKKKLFFESNRDIPSVNGLYEYDLKTKKVSLMFVDKNIGSSWIKTEQYKGQHFFIQLKSNTACVLKAIHMKTKKVTDIFTEENCLIFPVELLKNDQLLVICNHQRQFLSLAIINLKNMKLEYLQKDHWDVEAVTLSPDKKQLFIVKNIGGKSQLEQFQFPSMKKVECKFKNNGVISNLIYSKTNHELIIGFMSATEPKNFYRYNIKSKKTERLTDNWTSLIPENQLCMPKSVQFDSQGKKIQSWLFLPKTQSKKKAPVIIWPHGGPQAQERSQFRPILQYFVAKGFAIWAPNHHGSIGFGKDFANAINRNWGTADLPDMINGIDWLKKSKLIDESRICIMGGSYGGYMTLRSLTKIKNTFKVGVDIFGPSDLITFADSVPPDWKPFMDDHVGNPIKDKKMLTEQSPINDLKNIECPLLVVQGGKDPRVVQAESDKVVHEMKKLGKDVEYLVFEDEGHGFMKIENELKAYEKIANFIMEKIK
jgi:dienelactone hydrolase